MDKINLNDINHSQLQMMQEMHRMIALSGSAISPAESHIAVAKGSQDLSFANVFQQGMKNVDNLQHSADAMQKAVDMGQSDDLMGTMLESQKASIAFSAMVEVRNKLVTGLEQLINTPL